MLRKQSEQVLRETRQRFAEDDSNPPAAKCYRDALADFSTQQQKRPKLRKVSRH